MPPVDTVIDTAGQGPEDEGGPTTMMGYGDFGWMAAGWWWMALFWVALIALVVWGVSALVGPRGAAAESPLDILRRRYAAGEISEAEYEQARRRLA